MIVFYLSIYYYADSKHKGNSKWNSAFYLFRVIIMYNIYSVLLL